MKKILKGAFICFKWLKQVVILGVEEFESELNIESSIEQELNYNRI